MSVFLQDVDVTLYHGDVLDVLRELPDESVNCIATSPPFFALRDYGVDGQIGLEETPDAWAAALVAVFREARRVLRKDGTLWVECGDSYNSGTSARRNPTETAEHGRWENAELQERVDVAGLKAKDLLGTPWLLAFALRADGWWLRGCNIWAKPNAMPESAKDRCTTAHSYVFQLSKSARYWFDGDAISEPYQGFDGRIATAITNNSHQTHDNYSNREGKDRWPNGPDGSRNPRSVWTIPTQGYPEAHFATWPEALARRIILAGCPEWVCQECGKARERIVDVSYEKSPVHGAGSVVGRHYETGANNFDGAGMPRVNKVSTTLGYTDCGHNAYQPGVILDPFAGACTTLVVARRLRRHSIGIDLNGAYLALGAKRLATWWKSAPQRRRVELDGQQSLLSDEEDPQDASPQTPSGALEGDPRESEAQDSLADRSVGHGSDGGAQSLPGSAHEPAPTRTALAVSSPRGDSSAES